MRDYWARSYRNYMLGWHLTRRQVLKGAVLGGTGLAALALLGCGEEKPTGTTGSPEAGQPRRGGILRRQGANTTDGSSGFDPHVVTSVITDGLGMYVQTLLRTDLPDYKINPELAQKWEEVSKTEYLFHPQPGVKFHNKPPVNGRLLTAQDVVYSLERIRTAEPRFVNKTNLINVDKIEAVDNAAVKVTMKKPDASLLNKLAASTMGILAREAVDQFGGKLTTAESAIGTGPFVVQSAQAGVGMELVRNPQYWKSGLPYVDNVRLPFFTDLLLGYAGFQGRELDVAVLPGKETKSYIAGQGPGYKPDYHNWDASLAAAIPNTRVAPLNDLRVVKALRLLYDHAEIISAFTDSEVARSAYTSIFPASLDRWNFTHEEYAEFLEWKQPKDDAVKEAIKLLSAAGYSKDNPVKFSALFPPGANIGQAQVVQAQWKRFSQAAVDITIEQVPLPILFSRRVQGQFTFYFSGIAVGGPDLDLWFNNVRSGAAANFTGWGDPETDALIDKQSQEFDPNKRKGIVRDILKIMIDKGPFTLERNYYLTARASNVRGLLSEPNYPVGRQYEKAWLAA